MMAKISFTKNWRIVGLILGVIVLSGSLAGRSYLNRTNAEKFSAPSKEWSSPKKVEDYFVEHLRMSPQEADGIRKKPGVDGTVDLRISKETTLTAIVGNLYYYGFVRDEDAFKYALEHTKDKLSGNEGSIKVGKDGSIDVNAEYRISENMSAWEIADVLLNKPAGHFPFDEYGYFFMP